MRPARLGRDGTLRRHSWNKTIASADGRHFQVQARMFRMAAFVYDLEVGLMAAPNADQHVCLLMVFTEVTTETALSILNRFHVLTSCSI
jgi:hypothetical protein